MAAIDFPWLRRIRVSFSGLKPLESTGKPDALKITATIHKELSVMPPTTEILLHNLSENSRNALNENRVMVTIAAGWEQGPFAGLNECFKGTLLSAESNRAGPDIITRVYAMSGIYGLSNAHIEKTYKPGQKVADVVKELAGKIEGVMVDPAKIKGIKGSIPDGGWSWCGKVKDGLTKLGDEFSFSWTIVDDVFQAIGEGSSFGNTANVEEPYLISVNPILTGPQRLKKGLRWACTYKPTLIPGHFATVRSKLASQHNGVYRVNTVTHFLCCYADNGFTSSAMGYDL